MSGVGFAWAGKETKGRKRLESGVGSLGGRGGGWSCWLHSAEEPHPKL